MMFASVACNTGKTPDKGGKEVGKGGKKDEKHDHPHEGPHGGPLAEWGEEEFHVEFTVNHKKQEARVYVLGPDAKSPAPVKTKMLKLSLKDPALQIDLTPEPQKGEPEGASSVFVGKHEKLAAERNFAGNIAGEVNGKRYEGDFEEDEHDHKHGKKK
ncbi:MAG: hypothetical protein U0744_16800 [Gemmataceae bacterium]